ncbi:type II RES/Xre toxin-antitoxin system antitoxin [Zophobihabitans entericus]|uniref:DUF2384 domain-containing protein n=1 Tax=Zophobihabitans entericus TaxID=1635327 RepID=A0A6G9IDW0_9GAMM|nr:antitoxin Xre/MbcA/ParS toxin-binding domain-containing protein [Zophobihabitans entericus]QIQ21770.1 DUF2384 domain-containing protein [Zophobihabitans entericus]
MTNKVKEYRKTAEPIASSYHSDKIWQLAGFPASGGLTLIQELQRGLSVDVINRLNNGLNLSKKYVLEITGINERNLARRKKTDDQRLNPEESERVARLVRVMDIAIDLFDGDKDAAIDWLNTPAIALGNRSPVELLATETGALEVSNLIGRLEHGVFS